MAERERASLAWLSVHCGVASVALCNIIPYAVYVAAMMVVWLAWPPGAHDCELYESHQ